MFYSVFSYFCQQKQLADKNNVDVHLKKRKNDCVFYSVPYFFAPVKTDKKVVKLVAAPCGWEAGGARHMTRHVNKLFY